jgi:hypothetical protein
MDPIQPLDDTQSDLSNDRGNSSALPARSFGFVGDRKKHGSGHRQFCLNLRGFSFVMSQWEMEHEHE